MTLSSVIDHLRDQGEELESGVLKVLIRLGEDRSQLVLVLPSEDEEGDADFDDLVIWSHFASVDEVALRKVIELEGLALGFQKTGDFLSIQMSIRPWQLRDLDALDWIIGRVAIVADEYEKALLGTDEY